MYNYITEFMLKLKCLNPVDLSIVFRNLALATAIVIGGIWALWRWGFKESLRRRKESFAVDGELEASLEKYTGNSVIVSIKMVWNNKSPFSFPIEAKVTQIKIFELPDDLVVGNSISYNNFDKPKYSIFPFVSTKKIALEPNTESYFQNQIILNKGHYYLITWLLVQKSKPAITRTKEIVMKT